VFFRDVLGFELEGGSEPTTATFAIDLQEASGTYTFDSRSAGDTLIIEGSSDADTFTVSLDGSGREQIAAVYSGGATTVNTINMNAADEIVLLTLGGDDDAVVTVNGTALIDTLITFDGGTGSDLLTVTGTSTTNVSTVTYTPGTQIDAGRLVYNASAMIIDFLNLEPVVELVVADELIVNGTNADNAINYSQSDMDADWGKVSVDGFEPIHFANKEELTLNALAGDDVISLTNTTTPGVAQLLTAINVTGNDPTASDRVIVSGSAGDDTITYRPTAIDAGTVQVNALPLITLTTIEGLTIDGLSSLGNGDSLILDTWEIDGTQVLTPGSTFDSGLVDFLDGGNATVTAPALLFEGLGQNGSLTFTDIDPFDASVGRYDTLLYRGRDTLDTFSVNAAGDVLLNTQIPVYTPSIHTLILEGLAGDDTFNVVGDHPFTTLNVHGGSPGASDVLNFASSGGAVTVDLEAQTVTENSFGPVAYAGIETINLDAGEASPTIVATSADDDITVTVLDADSGRIERGFAVQQLGQVAGNVVAPLVNYTNTGGAALNIDLADGEDTLVVVGNALAQTFDVDVANSTVSVDDVPLGSNNGVVTYENNESLAVFGLEGNDRFDVTPGDIPVFVDGGDPIGVTPGDEIVIHAGGAGVAFEPGPENDEGGFLVDGNARVSFDHIEGGIVVDAACVLVVGTNADDDITVVARSEQANPAQFVGADGVQDFTTSVNDSIQILWIDVANLYIDALSGDDDIVVRTEAPNGADWDVHVRIVGGPPSAVTGDQGDVVEVETPGLDSAFYTPTGSETGELLLDTDGDGVYTSASTDTLIEIVSQFLIDCDGDEIVEYRSSEGGVEQLIYEGESAIDDLTVVLPAAQVGNMVDFEFNSFDFTGSVSVNSDGQQLLTIDFENIAYGGGANSITIDGTAGGADTLFYGGRDEVDQIGVDASGRITNLPLALPLDTPGIEDLVLLGRDGNDVFDIASDHPFNSIIVTGDGPDAGASADSNGDIVFVRGATGRAETITVLPNPWIDSETYIQGTGVNQTRNISNSGVERIYYLGADGDDTLVVDPGQGTHSVRVDHGRAEGSLLYPGPYDQVTTDSLPLVFGHALDTLRIAPATGAPGNVDVTFVTGDLTEAAEYEAVLGDDDTLVIEGSDGANDDHTVSLPPIGSVQIVDNGSGAQVTEISGDLGRLELRTLGGDDDVTVDVDSLTPSDVIGVPITFDGGTGSDLLTVTGNPVTAVDEVIYTPGPAITEGRLRYENAQDAGLMVIDFLNLEPVVDLVVANTLTVNGTNADNAINYIESPTNAAWDLVSVDGFETIEFANKDHLVIDGLAGDDVVNLNNSGTAAVGLLDI
ncbi:MAG: hypothetical protein GX594_17185, partial [Pirellulaceae bacterium]|nr:hypothetical protein [Pirellulaceae bacterium]